MNRRGFFKSLAVVATGAAVAPEIFIPKLVKPSWKVPVRWYKAEFRYVGMDPGMWDTQVYAPIMPPAFPFITEIIKDPQTGFHIEVWKTADRIFHVGIVPGVSNGINLLNER